MSENDQKIDFWGPEAEVLKLIEKNGKICQFQLDETNMFSELFQATAILYEPCN